jgi:hypothetical protein
MPIAEYLNSRGRFVLLQLPTFRTVVRLERGSFSLVAHKAQRRMSKIRSDYSTFIRSTAFPTCPFGGMHYLPDENAKPFQHKTASVHKTVKRFFREIADNWDGLTEEARDEIQDILTVRWKNSGSDRTMNQPEYVGPSVREFDEQAKRGPGFIELSYTYCRLDQVIVAEPLSMAYKRLDSLLWHWLMDADTQICSRVERDLTWLSDRPRIYKAVTEAIYIRRKWTRDIATIPLGHYAVWLHVMGRVEAARLIERLAERLQSFYKQWRGKNRNDGSVTSRKDAIKVLGKVGRIIPQFREAMEPPLDLDALVATS